MRVEVRVAADTLEHSNMWNSKDIYNTLNVAKTPEECAFVKTAFANGTALAQYGFLMPDPPEVNDVLRTIGAAFLTGHQFDSWIERWDCAKPLPVAVAPGSGHGVQAEDDPSTIFDGVVYTKQDIENSNIIREEIDREILNLLKGILLRNGFDTPV